VQILRGKIRGKTVELDEDPGLADGQEVEVVVRLPPGEGIRRSAGGWDDDPEGLDAYLEWNRQQRKIGRREFPE
jgi:hypothetical protein